MVIPSFFAQSPIVPMRHNSSGTAFHGLRSYEFCQTDTCFGPNYALFRSETSCDKIHKTADKLSCGAMKALVSRKLMGTGLQVSMISTAL